MVSRAPKFVKMHGFQGLAVNAGLHLPQKAERGQAPGLDHGGQGGLLEQGADVPVVPGRLGLGGGNLHFDAGEVSFAHPVGGDGDVGEPQGRNQVLQFRHRQPQVDQGPQGHIAADTGEAIKKGPTGLNSQRLIPPQPHPRFHRGEGIHEIILKPYRL